MVRRLQSPSSGKTHVDIILRDVEQIQQNLHSSGPHILLAHAIELLLKACLKAVAAQKPSRKQEDYGHRVDLDSASFVFGRIRPLPRSRLGFSRRLHRGYSFLNLTPFTAVRSGSPEYTFY
jgi:hypothetical protein